MTASFNLNGHEFVALNGGQVDMPIGDQVWENYFNSFKDKYDVMWMINYHEEIN